MGPDRLHELLVIHLGAMPNGSWNTHRPTRSLRGGVDSTHELYELEHVDFSDQALAETPIVHVIERCQGALTESR